MEVPEDLVIRRLSIDGEKCQDHKESIEDTLLEWFGGLGLETTGQMTLSFRPQNPGGVLMGMGGIIVKLVSMPNKVVESLRSLDLLILS
jgi:hypothetical protein